MKMYISKVSRLYSAILIGVSIVIACEKKTDLPDPQDGLHASWSLSGEAFVKQDNVEVTADYPNLSITFQDNGTYTTSNAKKLFHPTGTWAWSGSGITQLMLDGDFPVEVVSLSPSRVHLRFTLDVGHVNENGRTAAVVGAYEIVLNR